MKKNVTWNIKKLKKKTGLSITADKDSQKK